MWTANVLSIPITGKKQSQHQTGFNFKFMLPLLNRCSHCHWRNWIPIIWRVFLWEFFKPKNQISGTDFGWGNSWL